MRIKRSILISRGVSRGVMGRDRKLELQRTVRYERMKACCFSFMKALADFSLKSSGFQ